MFVIRLNELQDMTKKHNYSVNHKAHPKILNQLNATTKILMSVHMYNMYNFDI